MRALERLLASVYANMSHKIAPLLESLVAMLAEESLLCAGEVPGSSRPPLDRLSLNRRRPFLKLQAIRPVPLSGWIRHALTRDVSARVRRRTLHGAAANPQVHGGVIV